MKQEHDIPNLEGLEKLDDKSARALLMQLVMVVSMLRGLIEELRESLAAERHQREQLQRALFGPSSERLPPMQRLVTKHQKEQEGAEERAQRKAAAQKKREDNAQRRRDTLPSEIIDHPIAATCCPSCQAPVTDAAQLADEVSEEFEFVPASLVRREHHRKRRVCACNTFLYGEPVARVADAVIYGPGLHAHVVVAKCADSIPIERLSKSFGRANSAISRSTLNELFHRVADLTSPLYERMLVRVAQSEHVSADETTLSVQQKGKCRTAWMWTFIGSNLVTYVFSASRSGQTPLDVLGQSTGTLQVDAYTGYNAVTCPEGRTRSGCWSHVRRKFFEALKTSPDEATYVLDQILAMYLVEYEAVDKNILGTEAHRILRRSKTGPLVEALFRWLEAQKGAHLPKGPLGRAIGYALNQRLTLSVFLDEAKVSLDNNLSERNLRLIALGRKNFLFVGHDEGGRNLAILQSLVSSCIANEINPQEYLADVIMRIQDHPRSAIDELLPDVWRPSG
ncbi:MAG: IS66 family transposase [Bradymonadaceae bacterium]|nr:IS66 family transposase [Lujinxingiaceae bacterium]